jgi:peptidoglycan/LPS O-acetylase OafA/YrhL
LKYIKGFDTLRALAVFFVIIEHWGPFFTQHSFPQYVKTALVENGQFGVNLFFVLSGFLITSILLNEKLKNKHGQEFTIIKNFFIRRILRIFPIYYLVIIICCLFGYTFVQEHIWYFLTYTSNILPYATNEPNVLSHTWSLAVEEQFYLIWPWLIILINRKYLKHVMVLAIIVGIVSKYIAVYVLHHRFPVLVFNCFDSFGIGGMYAYIRLNRETCIKFERNFRIVFPFLLFLAWRMTPFGGAPVVVIYARTLDSLIALALIMFVINNQSEWMRNCVLENKTLNFIGKISYGIYLYHYTLGPGYDSFIADYAKTHPAMPAILSNFYFSYCVKSALLILVCWLSFRLIEEPILKLKKRFQYTD